MTDAELAAHLAEAAGHLLMELRGSGTLAGEALGRAGDAAANRYLIDALRAARPGDALLSEEEKDNPSRLAADRVWIIDPVDGTREYGEGRADWAVHVALAEGGAPIAGAVALPARGLVLRSDRVIAPPPAPTPAPLRMVVSRSRAAPIASVAAQRLGAQLVPMGSAGAKAMAVVLGEADIYLHSGGQYEWDNCAPAAVALAHGLHASRIDGAPLIYNRADTFVPDLLICRSAHVAPVMAIIAEMGREADRQGG